MRGIIIRWLITTLAILIVASVVPGIHVKSTGAAFIAAAVLGILNAFIRPVLLILTLPLTLLTMGLFIVVINALMFELAGFFVSGLQIASFWSALAASVLVSITSWALSGIVAGGGGEQTHIATSWNDVVDMRRDNAGKWK
jgi:putative membrane protein